MTSEFREEGVAHRQVLVRLARPRRLLLVRLGAVRRNVLFIHQRVFQGNGWSRCSGFLVDRIKYLTRPFEFFLGRSLARAGRAVPFPARSLRRKNNNSLKVIYDHIKITGIYKSV